MLEKNLLITNLQKEIRSSLPCRLEGIDIYLFGSVLYKANPEDVDVLIVYDEKRISIPGAINIRKKIKKIISNKIDMRSDICLLSRAENKKTRFSQEEQAQKLLAFRHV